MLRFKNAVLYGFQNWKMLEIRIILLFIEKLSENILYKVMIKCMVNQNVTKQNLWKKLNEFCVSFVKILCKFPPPLNGYKIIDSPNCKVDE